MSIFPFNSIYNVITASTEYREPLFPAFGLATAGDLVVAREAAATATAEMNSRCVWTLAGAYDEYVRDISPGRTPGHC